MARLVYGCRFDVPGADAWDTNVRPRYARWIADRYRKAFQTAVAVDLDAGEITGRVPEDHVLAVRRFEADGTATELEWAFPGDHGLIWRNLVRTAQLLDRCAVEHRVEIASADYMLSPAGYSVGAPVVVRIICQQPVLVGDMQVRATVYPLRGEGLGEFVQLLTAEQRRLPVVLLTPFANGEPGDLDARELADHLAGVAIVAVADTTATTRALSDQLGRLGCYNGGVRLYWPGFRPDDDLRRHPLILGSRIALLGPERAARSIERTIFSVAAFRFAPDPRIAGIIARSEAAARAGRAQEAVAQGDSSWEQYALEMSEQLDGALAEVETLRAENANLRANQNFLFSLPEQGEPEEAEEAVAREPETVVEAVRFAAQDCPGLLFLDSAYEAAEASPFKRAGEVYETLAHEQGGSGLGPKPRQRRSMADAQGCWARQAREQLDLADVAG